MRWAAQNEQVLMDASGVQFWAWWFGCLLDLQVEMSNGQLDVCVSGIGDKNEAEAGI